MRILLLCPHFSEYSLYLAHALVLQPGHTVMLVLNDGNFNAEIGDSQDWPVGAGLEIIRIPHRRTASCFIHNTWRYLQLIKSFDPDVVHIQEEPKDYLVFSLLFTNKPLILTVHDPRTHGGDSTGASGFSRRTIYKKYFRFRADAAVVHGERMREELRAKGFQKTIISVPHGPLGVRVQKRSSAWTAGRCLFFGRMQTYKGLGDFIAAVELLALGHPGAHGIIAGRGPDLDNFRDRLKNNPSFTVLDKYLTPAEVVNEFENANVVVLPYREASQSGVAAYALGVGRPMVVTAVGSLPDVVDNGMNGFVVQPRQPKALADAISLILADSTMALRMSEHSLTLGKGRLSWETAAIATVALYDDLHTLK